MLKSLFRRRILAVAAALVVGGAVASGVAIAAGVQLPFSGDGNTINGCYNASSGVLTVLTPTNTKCSTGYKAITWNQTGPKGDKGDNGAAGATGATGTSQVYYVDGGNQVVLPTTSPKEVVALNNIPAGKYLFTTAINNAAAYLTDLTLDADLFCATKLNGVGVDIGRNDGDGATLLPKHTTATDSFAATVPDNSSLSITCSVGSGESITHARVNALQINAIN